MLKKKLQRVNGVVIYMINLIDSLGLRPFLFVLCGVLFNLSIPNLTWGGFSLLTEARDWSEKKKKLRKKGIGRGTIIQSLLVVNCIKGSNSIRIKQSMFVLCINVY